MMIQNKKIQQAKNSGILREMDRNNKLNSVPFIDEAEEFNKLMGKSNNYEPTLVPEKEWRFVYDFILEELNEYKEACESGDIVGIADALGDILYVWANGVMLHGMKGSIEKVYAEIQRSNMSKACNTEEDAIATAEFRKKNMGIETHYEAVGDKWVVYRSSDRKVLKALDYEKPNLK